MSRSFSLCAAAFAGFLFIAGGGTGRTAEPPARPELFFYPPPALYPPNYRIWSPVTLTAAQITTDFPAIPEMDGVGLILYWNTICPRENQYDFSIIDQALSYWGARGKKVVLCVATVGFPVRMADGSLMSATPEWALAKVATYTWDSQVLPWNPDPAKAHAVFRFPSYWDPKFLEETGRLAAKLGERYDGNPNLSKMRIATGLLGEDNGTFDGINTKMPGFTKSNWIDYTRKVTDLYAAAFHKTQLEFDEGWISLIPVFGTPQEAAEARAYTESLFARRVFLAFNGLDSEDDAVWKNQGLAAESQWHQVLALDLLNLQASQARGGGCGLEAIGPLTGDKMKDIPALVAIVKALHPDRVLLFNEAAALAHLRQTPPGGPPTACLPYEVPPQMVEPMADHVTELFQGIGWPMDPLP